MDINDILQIKKLIIKYGKKLGEKNMSPASSGNISVRIGENTLISASGTCLWDLTENDIVLTDLDANVLEGDKKPSSEKNLHNAIYKLRSDINAIIHCHCPVITAFAVAHQEIKKPILPDFALFYDEIPLVPYYCPSSIELAEAVGKYFEKYNVVLLKNHGVVLGADTLQNAFYQLEMIRAYCETYFGAEVLGGARALSKKSVSEIKKLYIKK